MEEFLVSRPDLEWFVLRPGRLVGGDTGVPYRKEPNFPSQRFTTRIDLARALLDELTLAEDLRRAVAVSSR